MYSYNNQIVYEQKQTPVSYADLVSSFSKISDLKSKYDIFLFDAYGVFWDGSSIIKSTVEDMETLVKTGKKVIVVSNTTALGESAIKSYEKRGLKKGIHYTDFITSGDVFKSMIENDTIKKQLDIKERKVRVYVHGKPNNALFSGENGKQNFEIVDNLDSADAVYLSIPQYTKEEIEKLPNKKEIEQDVKLSSLTKEGEPERWDSVSLEMFRPFLEECKKRSLTLLNANPDKVAPEKEKGTNPTIVNQVIRNGSLTEYYRQINGKVIECGKPDIEIFKMALNKILENSNILEKSENRLNELKKKAVMIGDTPETDILGAMNAEIDSILLVGTGNTSRKLNNMNEIEQVNYLENINKEFKPTHIIKNSQD